MGRGKGEEMKDSASKNYYDVLQVSPKATKEVIDAAYKSLSRIYHPDNKKTGNEERFKTINAAHEVLTDAKKREAFDRERKLYDRPKTAYKEKRYTNTNYRGYANANGNTANAANGGNGHSRSNGAADFVSAVDILPLDQVLFELGKAYVGSKGNPIAFQLVSANERELRGLLNLGLSKLGVRA